jgi:hypothetical protein
MKRHYGIYLQIMGALTLGCIEVPLPTNLFGFTSCIAVLLQIVIKLATIANQLFMGRLIVFYHHNSKTYLGRVFLVSASSSGMDMESNYA